MRRSTEALRYLVARVVPLVALLGATGCETFVPYEPDVTVPGVAVSGAFAPDSVWTVQLRPAIPAGPERPVGLYVDDAAVRVTDRVTGEATALVPVGSGTYRADGVRPRLGGQYRLDVQTASGGALTANAETPSPPSFDVGPLIAGGEGDYFGIPVVRYTFELTLRAGAGGVAYAIELLPTEPSASELALIFTADDPDLRAEYADDDPVRNYTDFVEEGVYPTALYADRTVTITAQVPADVAGAVDLRVTTLSPDLLRHLVSRSEQEATEGSGLTEPVRVFSNVEGGVGIFAGFVRETVRLRPL